MHESETISSIREQLQDARDKIQHMLVVYERAVAERDDFSKQARGSNMQLSQQRLLMAHAQRQLDRARRENLKLRSDVKDLSGGRKLEVNQLLVFMLLIFNWKVKTGNPAVRDKHVSGEPKQVTTAYHHHTWSTCLLYTSDAADE